MTGSSVKLRPYHARVWGEPVIMELGTAGERGIIVPGEREFWTSQRPRIPHTTQDETENGAEASGAITAGSREALS